MNTRLTPEREKEIREHNKICALQHCVTITELLAELDAIRQERDELIAANVKREADIERIAAEVTAECKSELAREKELESQVEALSRTLRTVQELIRPPQTAADLIEASKQIREALREQSTMLKFNLFVDHERWEWNAPTITGEQMRELVGIPDSAQVFQKVQGEPDHEIHRAMVVDVSDGKQRFSTQAKGSYAGALREQS